MASPRTAEHQEKPTAQGIRHEAEQSVAHGMVTQITVQLCNTDLTTSAPANDDMLARSRRGPYVHGMIISLQRGAALAGLALALTLTLACARGAGDTGAAGDSASALAGDAAGFDSPRALGSLAGACPPSGAVPRTGATGTYENELERGDYVLLQANGTVIDSIDAEFGAHIVGTDSVVFIPIHGDTTGSPPYASAIGEPVVCAAGARILLRRVVPQLDPLFSSPTIHDSTVYYWGLRPLAESGHYFLTARRHHFPSSRADSLLLGELAMFTDDRHHLQPPRIVGDSVVYETVGNRWAWARTGGPAGAP